MQIGPCYDVAPKLIKCRECRPDQRSKNGNFCRFEAFRKLRYACWNLISFSWFEMELSVGVCGWFLHFRYTRNGLVSSAGFSNPIKDPTIDELKIWMADVEKPTKDLDMMQARYLLEQVADEFCDLYSQEQMAKSMHMSEGINRNSWYSE